MRGAPGSNDTANAADEAQVWERLRKRLLAIAEYRYLFRAAYPGDRLQALSFAHAANAIAALRIDAYASSNSPWQSFLKGNHRALTRRQMRVALSFSMPAARTAIADRFFQTSSCTTPAWLSWDRARAKAKMAMTTGGA